MELIRSGNTSSTALIPLRTGLTNPFLGTSSGYITSPPIYYQHRFFLQLYAKLQNSLISTRLYNFLKKNSKISYLNRPNKSEFIVAKYKDLKFCQAIDNVNIDSLNKVSIELR